MKLINSTSFQYIKALLEDDIRYHSNRAEKHANYILSLRQFTPKDQQEALIEVANVKIAMHLTFADTASEALNDLVKSTK